MKILAESSNRDVAECARLVMEAAPLLGRIIKREMRRQRPEELSLPQFRALRFLQRHPGSSLTQLAARLDLTPASTSKMIDVLAKHGLVIRASCVEDRRQIRLRLTAPGEETLQATEEAASLRLAELFTTLPAEECATIIRAMQTLRAVLGEQDDDAGPDGKG